MISLISKFAFRIQLSFMIVLRVRLVRHFGS